MYRVKRVENILFFDDDINELVYFQFGIKDKPYKIKEESVRNILIYQKELAYPLAQKQVGKKYEKLMLALPELLLNDEDDDGESLKEVLNQIEKFRQIIKNKYRAFLTKKELEQMAKKLQLMQKEAKQRIIEINNSKIEEKSRSSCR